MKNTVILGIVGLFIVGGLVISNMKPTAVMRPVQNNPTSVPAKGNKEVINTITMSEIETHNTPSDCWTVVEGKVYDLTSFIAQGQHPAVITESCGKDGTQAFLTRGERNSPHPEGAREVLTTLYLGQLGK